MESNSKSQNLKYIAILMGSREKLWSTGNWFYAGASNGHNFGEPKDFCCDSHKASDTKEHVSSQYILFRKRHWAIIAFYFELYQELSSQYSFYRNSWLQFQINFLQVLKYGMETWGGGGKGILLMGRCVANEHPEKKSCFSYTHLPLVLFQSPCVLFIFTG